SEPIKVYPPLSRGAVPLGAQSVIQAGDPGPGGVRYIPVPMVTIPDVRRPPTPPLMNSAQVYGAAGTAPAATDPALANAFTPALSRQAVAQSTNAFGSIAPPMPAAAAAPAVPMSGS